MKVFCVDGFSLSNFPNAAMPNEGRPVAFKNSISKKMMLIPPTHSWIDLNKIRDCGIVSGFAMMVIPVVVYPETLSKRESISDGPASWKIELPRTRYGIAPISPITRNVERIRA